MQWAIEENSVRNKLNTVEGDLAEDVWLHSGITGDSSPSP